jgi:hypothetical protein
VSNEYEKKYGNCEDSEPETDDRNGKERGEPE